MGGGVHGMRCNRLKKALIKREKNHMVWETLKGAIKFHSKAWDYWFITLESKKFNVVERGGKKSADMIYYADKPENGTSNALGVSGSFSLFRGEWRRMILTLCFSVLNSTAPLMWVFWSEVCDKKFSSLVDGLLTCWILVFIFKIFFVVFFFFFLLKIKLICYHTKDDMFWWT